MKMRLPFLKRHSRTTSKEVPVTLLPSPSKKPPSPLDIPEILEIIFSFVDDYTRFKTVVLVCREWCIMNLGTCKEVVWDGTWESQDLVATLARVPGVGYIRWHSEVGHDQESHWDRLIKALKSNHERYLKRLQQQPPREPSSRRLSMDGRRDERCEFQMSLLFKACPGLEELRAETDEGAFYLPGQWIPLETSKPLALRALVLRNAHFLQSSLEELLVLTPHLKELKLINLARGNGCYPEEGQMTSKYQWQGLFQHIRALPLRLRSVHFSVRDEITTDDDLRSMLFGVCPRSTDWTLWASDLKPLVVQSMNELPNHITNLDLYWHDRSGCLSAASDTLNQYLCASPHLMHLRMFNVGFDFKHMDVHNRAGLRYSAISEDRTTTATTLATVTSGKPGSRDEAGACPQVWKCRNLKTLYIELHGHGDEMIKDPVQSRIIFGYIAAVCPQLRDLHIKVPWTCRSNNEVYYPAICLQLEGGLCHLARLRHLTRLRFQDWTSGTSRYDLNWMTPLGQSVRYRRRRQEVMAQWEPWLEGEAKQESGMIRTLQGDGGQRRDDCTLPAQLCDLGLLRAVKTMVEEIDGDGFRCWPEIQGLSLTGKFERRPQDELQSIFPSKRLSIF
ncbi:hypothetical protein BGZ97_012563 [Linnemannia gamsii]|uniref:F-box domain-containing protein n=1 Tax=Linnemannia gamsii TaxID=64522 RepID=A0A9P6R588_9FUNG|nr:hypothetical protein BGZ97_012563 [Linnemannia gamsii]